MSEDKFVNEHPGQALIEAPTDQQIELATQMMGQLDAETSPEPMGAGQVTTLEEAQWLCQTQMQELLVQIQDKTEEEKQELILQAQKQCNDYLQGFVEGASQTDLLEEHCVPEQLDEQEQMLVQQHLEALAAGGLPNGLQDKFDTATLQDQMLGQNGTQMENLNMQMLQQQAMEQQRYNQMMMSQFSPNQDPDDIMKALQDLQNQIKHQQMGNQLRLFAKTLFGSINQRQKNRLETKAKNLLSKVSEKQFSNSTGLFDSTNDFEFNIDPGHFLDEIDNSVRRHPEMQNNFQRFKTLVFDDPEYEQTVADFMEQFPTEYHYYRQMAYQYNIANMQDNTDQSEFWGTHIFNIVMPFAQKIDHRLLNLIPKDTLQKFKIVYDSNKRITSWEELELSHSRSSDSDQNSDDESGSGNNDQSGTSNEQNISSNSQAIGQSSEGQNHKSVIQDDDESMMLDNDMSQAIDFTNEIGRKGGKLRHREQIGGSNVIPQSALTGRNRSLSAQLAHSYPALRNINKHEIKVLDNMFKSLKEEKDWHCFCKLLYLYFEGVFTLTEVLKLFEDKFSNKVKQEIKEEVGKLIPTRDQNRRAVSNLLKTWNDIENLNQLNFEKIPDSSYYKITEGFPVPTCTKKMLEEIYFGNINDKYLSASIGLENFKSKFRNTNEENVYRTEDKMYEIDTQIDNVEKSLKIVQDQLTEFELLSEEEQNTFKFPVQILNPLRFYWDQKFRKTIHDQFFKEGKFLRLKEMLSLKQQFVAKLEFLKQQKSSNINELKDQFRKNFNKSLDHKSFQYKDNMNKFLKKVVHINMIKLISEENNIKKRLSKNDVNLLYGSGEQNINSDYRFFNTFGKDFSGKFDLQRLEKLKSSPDYPIDMDFMSDLDPSQRWEVQPKCPHVRLLFDDKQALEISLKLIIQYIKLTNLQSNQVSDRQGQLNALKFIMINFMKVSNFEELERESDRIQPLTPEIVEVLMNSALYYEKKYEKELPHMDEVFPFEDPSSQQSPLKIKSSHNIQQIESEQKQQEPEQESQEQASPNQDQIVPGNPELIKINQKLFKEVAIKQSKSCAKSIDEFSKLQQDIFVPRYPEGEQNKKYQLMYGPLNVHMFLVYFYSVYERTLKAKQLVERKMIQDFKDDFCRKEWSTKFRSRTQTIINERFTYLIKAILTLMSQNNILDTNKYEDVARELLGNEAYMLFSTDKLISHCQKQLNICVLDQNCSVARQLFTDFSNNVFTTETQYLSTFFKTANDLANSTLQAQQKPNTNQGSTQSQLNKDTANPNMNQQSFRFLFSPSSGILTIHLVVMHPFQLQDQKKATTPANIVIIPSNYETVNGLTSVTTRPMDLMEEPLPVEIVDDSTEPEIYLERNLKLMKKTRDNQKHQVSNQNGLEFNLMPVTSQMIFCPNTEDQVIVKRPQLLGKRPRTQFAKDMEYHEAFMNKRLKRLKTMNEETGMMFLNEHIEVELKLLAEEAQPVPIKKMTRSQLSSQQKSQNGSRKPTPNKSNNPEL